MPTEIDEDFLDGSLTIEIIDDRIAAVMISHSGDVCCTLKGTVIPGTTTAAAIRAMKSAMCEAYIEKVMIQKHVYTSDGFAIQ